MKTEASAYRYIYGPVPSRRLGLSLGIDLVPYKTCSYDCVYCQLGRTINKTIERKEYVDIDNVIEELKRKIATGPTPDYISLAGSGEPTLNLRIGDLIEKIKRISSIPIAVLTNGSLLWQDEVRTALMAADLVLPSLDAADETLFQYVNRPHEAVSFDLMVGGLKEFIRIFPGDVWLEVFLLAGVTGIHSEIKKLAALIKMMQPARVQLNTVSRPPTEDFAEAVMEKQMERFKRLLSGTVEVISEYSPEDSPVSEAGGATADIIALLKRRPCTLEDISAGLALSPIVVMKELDDLRRQGIVDAVTKRSGIFYRVMT